VRSLYIHVQLQLSISLLNRGVAACASGKDQITSDSLAVIEQVVLYTASAVSQTKKPSLCQSGLTRRILVVTTRRQIF